MNSDFRKILIGVAQFLLCSMLCTGAVGLYYLNLKVEICVENLIELGQEAFLLGSALLMIRTAMQEKALWALYSDSSCGSYYAVKSLSEESTELLAYMMIFFSAVFYAYDLKKKRVK